MSRDVAADQAVFISSVPAGRRDRRLAIAVVAFSLLIFAATLPFVRRQLPEVWAFIPIYESLLIINDLITAVILFGQFRILRSRAILALANGYLATAAIAVPHLLTFPGLFGPTGLLGAGPHSTAWLYMFWHAVFPVAVIAYALLKGKENEVIQANGSGRALMLGSIIATVAMVAALALLATTGKALLPGIMRGNNYAPTFIAVISIVWALSVIALASVWWCRPHTVLDVWLMVVMCAWLIDVALSAALNGGRFDLGFYAGRLYGLVAATTVLLVLLLETSALYAQLAQLFAHEQRERRHEAEERRRVFETSLDLILVVSQKGLFYRVSPSSKPILGYEPSELIGRSAREFVHPDDLDAIRQQMRNAVQGQGVHNFPTRYFHKDGRIVTLSWSGVWSEPEQRHFFIGRDVTEQKRLERMKDEFISTVNHELRTPITTIAGPLGLLAHMDELPDSARRLITMAQANAIRLTHIVNDVLDFERLEGGKMEFAFRLTDARAVVEQAVDGYRAIAQRYNVSVIAELPAGECVVFTDPERLSQVIGNLLSNAIKFSPFGDQVTVSIEECGEHFSIAVRDNGSGIPEEFRPRLFDKFAIVDATDNRKKGGAGLGLSIAKHIMLGLAGDVTYLPTIGGGATFCVHVPRQQAMRATPSPMMAPSASPLA